MQKHTPAPWSIDAPGTEDQSIWHIPSMTMIADRVLDPHNARLIANAPNVADAARAMLAALEDACASLEMQAATYAALAKVQNQKANDGLAAELRRNVTGYRAAIAQAKAAGI